MIPTPFLADNQCICIFGFIFAGSPENVNPIRKNFCSIRARQYWEVTLAILPIWIAIIWLNRSISPLIFAPFTFYIIYIIEGIIKAFLHSSNPKISRVSFLEECEQNKDNLDYLSTRSLYAFIGYI